VFDGAGPVKLPEKFPATYPVIGGPHSVIGTLTGGLFIARLPELTGELRLTKVCILPRLNPACVKLN